jgi:hypothetical protein
MILPASPPYCHSCGGVLIGRDWYDITAWHLSGDGCCAECGMHCHGVFEKMAGRWGRRRQPVRLCAFDIEPLGFENSPRPAPVLGPGRISRCAGQQELAQRRYRG